MTPDENFRREFAAMARRLEAIEALVAACVDERAAHPIEDDTYDAFVRAVRFAKEGCNRSINGWLRFWFVATTAAAGIISSLGTYFITRGGQNH